MKKKLMWLVTTVLVLVTSEVARSTLINSNSIIQDEIEYYIQTDKFVYDLGEDVAMMFRVTNLRDEEWMFSYVPPVLDILIAAKEEGNFNTVWFWSWDRILPMALEVFHLQPDQSVELEGIWSQIDLNNSWEIEDDIQVLTGTYGIGGRIGRSAFNDIIGNAPVTLEIIIIPEPGSLALLGIGLTWLLFHNKKNIKHIQ